MKKNIIQFILLPILFLVFGLGPAFAAANINDLTNKVAQSGGYQINGVTDTTLSQTVGKVIKVVLGLLGTIFLALTFYAGVLWMTAGGNEDNIEKAKKILSAAVIGLVIVMAAYSITYFVTTFVFGASSQTGQIGT
jgi:hypothetical protein